MFQCSFESKKCIIYFYSLQHHVQKQQIVRVYCAQSIDCEVFHQIKENFDLLSEVYKMQTFFKTLKVLHLYFFICCSNCSMYVKKQIPIFRFNFCNAHISVTMKRIELKFYYIIDLDMCSIFCKYQLLNEINTSKTNESNLSITRIAIIRKIISVPFKYNA